MPTECLLQTTFLTYVPNAEMPFNLTRVKHLYRRLGYGDMYNKYQDALSLVPENLVNEIISNARNTAPTAKPIWGDWAQSDYSDFQTELQSQILEFALAFADDILENPIRAKLTMFWQNHFAARVEQYVCPSWMYQYQNTIQTNQFGNFKDFVKEIGKTPAMLVFLNGVQNTRFSPNENYARELFELFTLGVDNGYTQQDITETARALTGWNGFSELCADIAYVPSFHDPGQKTIFGQQSNWNYDTLHDLLFEQRGQEIANFICRKIYCAFISPDVDEEFISEMADFLVDSDFELLPLYEKLFTCERFFDEGIIGTIIKSPVEYFVTFIRESGMEINQEIKTVMIYQMGELGQTVFNPPTVAGWSKDREWITTSYLTQRWIALEAFVYQTFVTNPNLVRQYIKNIASSNNDPLEITTEFVDFHLSKALQNQLEYEQLNTYFKWEVPENYYEDGSWNLEWETVPIQTIILLQKIIRTPEFQMI